MTAPWAFFDLNGTLLDASVMAEPLGGGEEDRALVAGALEEAVAYAMVTTLSRDYQPFSSLVGAALRRRLALAERDPAVALEARDRMARMPAFPEAGQALDTLHRAGWRLAVLTQSATGAAEDVLAAAGLRERFEMVLGSDQMEAFKPDPRPYEHALRQAAGADAVWLVAAHWWDVAGARRAGLRTAWISRADRVLPGFVLAPDVSAPDLAAAARRMLAAG